MTNSEMTNSEAPKTQRQKAPPSADQPAMSDDRVRGGFGIGVGMLIAIIMPLFLGNAPLAVKWLVMLPATGVFVTGCAFYARSKGYPLWMGALGLGWVFGLIALIVLPDRTHNYTQEFNELQRQIRERRAQRAANASTQQQESANRQIAPTAPVQHTNSAVLNSSFASPEQAAKDGFEPAPATSRPVSTARRKPANKRADRA